MASTHDDPNYHNKNHKKEEKSEASDDEESLNLESNDFYQLNYTFRRVPEIHENPLTPLPPDDKYHESNEDSAPDPPAYDVVMPNDVDDYIPPGVTHEKYIVHQIRETR